MARALARQAAPYVVSHEDGAAERHRPAVVTPRHAWRRAGVLLMAAGSRRRRRLTPHFAQKRGVLADAHHHHDRENSCSKHVTPATCGARVAPASGHDDAGKSTGFLGIRELHIAGYAKFRRSGAENPAAPTGPVQRSAAVVCVSSGTEAAETTKRLVLRAVSSATRIGVELRP
jgi:hypothetical protein